MSEIPVNQYTASELVRLCLRRQDKINLDSDTESEASEAPYDEDVVCYVDFAPQVLVLTFSRSFDFFFDFMDTVLILKVDSIDKQVE